MNQEISEQNTVKCPECGVELDMCAGTHPGMEPAWFDPYYRNRYTGRLGEGDGRYVCKTHLSAQRLRELRTALADYVQRISKEA